MSDKKEITLEQQLQKIWDEISESVISQSKDRSIKKADLINVVAEEAEKQGVVDGSNKAKIKKVLEAIFTASVYTY